MRPGTALHGGKRYTITFAQGQRPPVHGFWSLALYDEHHFFVPNPQNRYTVGTKTRDLKANADGSLTLYVQPDEPADPNARSNWLPSPASGDFSLYLRAYWPAEPISEGKWAPPPVLAAR